MGPILEKSCFNSRNNRGVQAIVSKAHLGRDSLTTEGAGGILRAFGSDVTSAVN